jgi:hypothetical protein
VGKITMFPGVAEVPAAQEIEPDLDESYARQQDLLARWAAFGEELKRRAEYPLPLGLEIELADLLNQTDE